MSGLFKLFIFVFVVGWGALIYFGASIITSHSDDTGCGNKSMRESEHLKYVSNVQVGVDVWPWQVSILYRPNTTVPFTQICGGSIVHKYWVMTAASCTRVNQSNLLIRAGSNRLDVDDEFTQQSEVAKIIRHKRFNPVTLRYSVALLQVKPPFEFNDFVSPICVPDENTADHYYESCHVTGYNTQPGDDFGVLQESEVHLISRTACNKPALWDYTVSADMLCISKFDETADECEAQTNFGGPLNCYIDVLHAYFLIGIQVKTSCGELKRPMVYFKVYTLYYWIEQEMNISIH